MFCLNVFRVVLSFVVFVVAVLKDSVVLLVGFCVVVRCFAFLPVGVGVQFTPRTVKLEMKSRSR